MPVKKINQWTPFTSSKTNSNELHKGLIMAKGSWCENFHMFFCSVTSSVWRQNWAESCAAARAWSMSLWWADRCRVLLVLASVTSLLPSRFSHHQPDAMCTVTNCWCFSPRLHKQHGGGMTLCVCVWRKPAWMGALVCDSVWSCLVESWHHTPAESRHLFTLSQSLSSGRTPIKNFYKADPPLFPPPPCSCTFCLRVLARCIQHWDDDMSAHATWYDEQWTIAIHCSCSLLTDKPIPGKRWVETEWFSRST